MKKLTLMILLLVITACSNEENSEEELRHIAGFDSLPRNLIGNGSTGALAGVVHGWEMRNWNLAANYMDGKKEENIPFLDSLFSNYYLYGFEAGTIQVNNTTNHLFKNCTWTMVTAEDTITVVTDVDIFNKNPAKNEWVMYKDELKELAAKL